MLTAKQRHGIYAAIVAILEGTEQITRKMLDGIPPDHAAQSRAPGTACWSARKFPCWWKGRRKRPSCCGKGAGKDKLPRSTGRL